MAFVLFAPLAFIVLWLGVRWPLRRVLLVSLVVGLLADVLFDILASAQPLNFSHRIMRQCMKRTSCQAAFT